MTLEKEIHGGESARLELKEARPKDSVKFMKTVVAFANSKGGRIVFGVEDGTRRIVGVPREALGLPKPFVGEEAGFFKVVFYRREGNEPINEPINLLLTQMIANEPGISKPQLVAKIGKSRATVTRALSVLRNTGRVEYRGSKKTGGYFVR